MLLVVSAIRVYHEYKDVWSEGSGKFCFCSGDGKTEFFAPQVSTHTRANFIWKSGVLQKWR